jgi:hypothetical protein
MPGNSNSKLEEDLSTLKTTVAATQFLVSQLQTAVTTSPSPEATKKAQKDIDVLALAHDAAKLIRAHTTKISLLIISKPFTPTALTTVLRELSSAPLPGIASAVELCDTGTYTKAMRGELQWRVEKVLAEFKTLVAEIPLDGNVLTVDQKNGTAKREGKGSLANTGVVWQACDELMDLQNLGIAGLVVKKAEQYRDTLKDALEELEEWGEETSDDEGEDGNADEADDDEDGIENTAQDEIDDLFGSQRHISADDPAKIRDRLISSVRRLKLIVLMFQAIIKRRFKTLPPLPHPPLPTELEEKSPENPGIIQCLDNVLDMLKQIPDLTDELANAFYELDDKEIDKYMEQCFFKGFGAVEMLIDNWEGQNDEFSTWVSFLWTSKFEFSISVVAELTRFSHIRL